MSLFVIYSFAFLIAIGVFFRQKEKSCNVVEVGKTAYVWLCISGMFLALSVVALIGTVDDSSRIHLRPASDSQSQNKRSNQMQRDWGTGGAAAPSHQDTIILPRQREPNDWHDYRSQEPQQSR